MHTTQKTLFRKNNQWRNEIVIRRYHCKYFMARNKNTCNKYRIRRICCNAQPSESYAQDRFRNPGKRSISSIIGGYKSAVTKHANRMGIEFGWQSRFYDHIIRNDQSFQRISKYIIENPTKWGDDCFY